MLSSNEVIMQCEYRCTTVQHCTTLYNRTARQGIARETPAVVPGMSQGTCSDAQEEIQTLTQDI